MKKIIPLMCLVLLLSVTSAATLGTFKEGDCLNLIQVCDNCTYNNISSVLYPNSTIALQNVAMTKDDTFYNYSYCDTNTTGNYIVNGFGDLDGDKTGWSYDFDITPSGNSLDTSSAIAYGITLFLMFGVTIFFLIFASKTDAPGVKLFFNMIGYVTMFLAVSSGYILLQSSVVQSNMSSTMSALMFVLSIVLVVIMFYIFINQTRHALALMKAKKGFGSEFDNPPTF